MIKTTLLLDEWRNRCGIITRKDAKAFYDAINHNADPNYTGQNVHRILTKNGRCIGKMPLGDAKRMIDVWVLTELWPVWPPRHPRSF